MKFKIITEGGSEIDIDSFVENGIVDEVVLEIDGKKYKISIIEIE